MDHDRIESDTDGAPSNDVEGLLTRLAPAPSRLSRTDRDRLMFSAGEAAGRRNATPRRETSLRIWQGIAATLAIATAGLAWNVAALATRAGVAERPLIVQERPAPIAPEEPIAGGTPRDAPVVPLPRVIPPPARTAIAALPPIRHTDDPRGYLAVRHVALTRGIDALPHHPPGGAAAPSDRPEATYGALRRSWNDDAGHL
jgi:hypothetical protein